MFKLLKYLKQSTVPIIAIFLLLIIQASSDLSLPEYTSNIVNVGIQQGGVENVTPTVIRESQMNKLLLFVNEKEKEEVLDSYTLLSKETLSTKDYDSYKISYSVLENENLLKLETKDKDKISDLNQILAKPMLVVSMFEGTSEEALKLQEQIKSQLPAEMASLPLLEVVSQMPGEQLDGLLGNIKKQFEAMSPSIMEQSAVVITKAEYKTIGIDISKMQSRYILIAGLKMLGLALISMVATILVGFIGAKVAAKLGQNLRSRVFKQVVNFSNTEFDKFSTASLITRSTNDIQQVQMLMVMLLRMIFYAPILGIGGVIKVFGTNTSMAWIIAVAVMAILTLVLILFGIAMPKFKLMQKLVDKLNLVTREILTGIQVIRAFSTEKHEESRFEKANNDLTKTNLFVNRVMTFMMPLMTLVMNAITILIVLKGAEGIDAGNMQVGDMMAFIQYTMQIIMSFLMLSMLSIMLPRASVSANRIVEVLDTPNTILDPKEAKSYSGNSKGYIEFKNVSFKYPKADEDVLTDISFTAKPGETTAIIGSTGSGKSTLINLIPRFFDVTKGQILVDGLDVRDVSQHELREQLGFIPQKGVLFSGTIDSNLRYGREESTQENIEKAARIAQATEFIEAKEGNYQATISQGGSNVSGGQKQRLSIARAIAKDPQIYIFDDSFSALDYKTDVTLRKALKKELADRTIIIVAQRISTILNAEQILVLDEGKIVGKGSHKELLKNCEVYKQIAQSQLSKEELDNE